MIDKIPKDCLIVTTDSNIPVTIKTFHINPNAESTCPYDIVVESGGKLQVVDDPNNLDPEHKLVWAGKKPLIPNEPEPELEPEDEPIDLKKEVKDVFDETKDLMDKVAKSATKKKTGKK